MPVNPDTYATSVFKMRLENAVTRSNLYKWLSNLEGSDQERWDRIVLTIRSRNDMGKHSLLENDCAHTIRMDSHRMDDHVR
jgi:hypothetical protein